MWLFPTKLSQKFAVKPKFLFTKWRLKVDVLPCEFVEFWALLEVWASLVDFTKFSGVELALVAIFTAKKYTIHSSHTLLCSKLHWTGHGTLLYWPDKCYYWSTQLKQQSYQTRHDFGDFWELWKMVN